MSEQLFRQIQTREGYAYEPVECLPNEKTPTVDWDTKLFNTIFGILETDAQRYEKISRLIVTLLAAKDDEWRRKIDHVMEVLHNCHGGGDYRRKVEQLKDELVN